jgi:SAM-dependent methyltransferase
VIVPLVYELVKPASVVDIGCGNGAWLAEFARLGATRVLGVDGDYVDRGSLRIDPSQFVATDLSEPWGVQDRFDLAICLEVAEHLPESAAPPFVAGLTALAPVVLFSAAIPFQGGVGHVNERWPEYWADQFAACGYVAADCIRQQIWSDPDVEFWYAQNAILFLDPARAEGDSALSAAVAATHRNALSRVHPAQYLAKANGTSVSVRERVRAASRGALRALGRR